MEYQVSPRNPGDYTFVMRWFVAVLLVVLAVLTVDIVVNGINGIPTGGFHGYQAWVLLTIVSATLALVTYGVFALGPGPIRCTWSDHGFVLYYGSGRQRSFEWGDPGFHLAIVKYVDADRSTTYEINQGIPIHNPIGLELYNALLTEAQRRGFNIRVRVTRLMSGEMIASQVERPRRATT